MRTDRSTLDLLQGLLASSLIQKLKDGTATAADLNVARQLLKDNNVSVLPMESSKDVQELASQLPFTGHEELQAEKEYIQ